MRGPKWVLVVVIRDKCGRLPATMLMRVWLLTAPGDQITAFDTTVLLALLMARGQKGKIPLLRRGAVAPLPCAGRSRGTAERVAGDGADPGMVRLDRGRLAHLAGRFLAATHFASCP